MPDYGLGRLEAPDARDEAFPLRALLPAAPSPRTHKYWWPSGWWGDQGALPWCVAYSWRHWVEDGPVAAPGHPSDVELRDAYHWMQLNDEWPGTDYDGTSVRAGAKFWQERGVIGEYRWAWTLDTVVQALLEAGPVVLGTNWYSGMFTPDRDGIIRPTGSLAGGHAYLANGVNVDRNLVRIKNSWGRSWGRRGYAWLPFGSLERLLIEDGDACMPLAAG